MTRDLRLLSSAIFLSSAGDLLALVVLALQVHALTGDGLAVAALFATTLVPTVAAAPLAGSAADRFESVHVIVAASLVQAAVACGLAFSTGLATILVLSSVLAGCNAIGRAAEFALVPAVAGPRGLTHATGVVESARYAGSAAGPLLAAVLAAVGPQPALLANAVSFAAVAAAAWALRARRPPAPRGPDASARALDGLRLLCSDPVMRVTLAAACGALLFVSATLTVQIFFLKDVVGAGDTAYALLVCAWMVGMVGGATMVAPRVAGTAMAGAALIALAAQGAGLAAQTAWAILPVSFAGYVAGGVAHGAKNVLLRALIAVRVPGALHGRAFAAYNAARHTAELGAVATGGVLVEVLGPRPALALAAAAPIVAGTAGLALLRANAPPASPVSRSV